jgi:hypothetical protein
VNGRQKLTDGGEGSLDDRCLLIPVVPGLVCFLVMLVCGAESSSGAIRSVHSESGWMPEGLLPGRCFL